MRGRPTSQDPEEPADYWLPEPDLREEADRAADAYENHLLGEPNPARSKHRDPEALHQPRTDRQGTPEPR